MADQPQSSTTTSRANQRGVSISELVELVKTYAEQETVGPLRGAGRWLALGTAGAAVLGLGLTLLTLGLLRLLQTEWVRSATGSTRSISSTLKDSSSTPSFSIHPNSPAADPVSAKR